MITSHNNHGGNMSSNLHKLFKMDSSLEQDGVWFEVTDTTKFKIRRFGGSNTKLSAAYAKHYKTKARLIESGQLPENESRRIFTSIFVESCLVGWEGVTDEDGNEIPFTVENAMNLLSDLPELFDTLWGEAKNQNNYREDLGNS